MVRDYLVQIEHCIFHMDDNIWRKVWQHVSAWEYEIDMDQHNMIANEHSKEENIAYYEPKKNAETVY